MIDISFSAVIPEPLSGITVSNSSIWDTGITFNTGQSYKVYAPSGTGKSTFMHIMYGLRNDYSGNVTISGKNINSITPNEWATIRKDTLSIIFQDLRLFDNLSAFENVMVKAALYNDKGLENTAKEMAEKLKVSHLLDQSAATLSYGERQRFAIIRALIQPFDWLLMDEPFSHLDDENTKRACELIGATCQKNNAGFILASLGEDYYLKYDKKIVL